MGIPTIHSAWQGAVTEQPIIIPLTCTDLFLDIKATQCIGCHVILHRTTRSLLAAGTRGHHLHGFKTRSMGSYGPAESRFPRILARLPQNSGGKYASVYNVVATPFGSATGEFFFVRNYHNGSQSPIYTEMVVYLFVGCC